MALQQLKQMTLDWLQVEEAVLAGRGQYGVPSISSLGISQLKLLCFWTESIERQSSVMHCLVPAALRSHPQHMLT